MAGEVPVLVRQARRAASLRPCAAPGAVPAAAVAGPGSPPPGDRDAGLLQYVLRKRSMRSVTELTVRGARQMLAAWAAEQDAAGRRRDEVVQAAIDAGLSKSEVHRLAGMARTATGRIAGAVPALEQDPR